MEHVMSIVQHPIVQFVLILVAIAGVILSIIFYNKGKKIKKPVYMCRTINLINDNIQKFNGIAVTYQKEEIKNLSITKIAFWNEGKDTILSADIAKANPIRISINNQFDILGCDMIHSNNSANDFKTVLEADKKSVALNFDYIDYENGAVMQIYHTGKSNRDILITGQIKSVKAICEKENVPSFFIWLRSLKDSRKAQDSEVEDKRMVPNQLKRRRFMGYYSYFMGLSLIAFSVLMFFPKGRQMMVTIDSGEAGTMFAIIYMVTGVFVLWFAYETSKRKIPKGLDMFYEEF